MTLRGKFLLAVLSAGICLFIATIAWAVNTLTVQENFTPDRLGVSSNLSITAKFSSAEGPPSPVTNLTLYAPGGLAIDAQNVGTCTATTLANHGPSGCPADSRAGFGGGIALITFSKTVIHEPYTIDFFFAPREHGHLAVAAYASAVAPVPVELVVLAKEVPAPKPYGLGFSVEVPTISTLPGAAPASIESAFATFGASNVAYYKTIHHKRRLVHLKGLITPKSCPAGGFPTEGIISFADGSTLTVKPPIPCPSK